MPLLHPARVSWCRLSLLLLLILVPAAANAQHYSVDQISPEVPGYSAADMRFPDGTLQWNAADLGLLPSHSFDAYSDGLDALPWCAALKPVTGSVGKYFYYSVDRLATGGHVTIYNEVIGNGAAADIFSIAEKMPLNCPGGGTFAPPTKVCDATSLLLTPTPGVESDIDALDMGRSCGLLSVPYRVTDNIGAHFSVDPFTAGQLGASPADIFYQATPGSPVTPPPVFASEAKLGLVPGDDIDAIAIYDVLTPGQLNPGDIVYVSLKALSPTLISMGAHPGDILEVYPSPTPVVVMPYSLFGLQPGDELDALTIFEPVADGNGDQSFRIYNHSPEIPYGAGQMGPSTAIFGDDFNLCSLGVWSYAALGSSSIHANLFPGLSVAQDDPCTVNLTCAWSFFWNSNADFACGGHPGQLVVPEPPVGPIANEVISPLIPLAGSSGNRVDLEFDVYSDLRLDALVFYRYRVRGYVSGFPTEWKTVGNFYGRNVESGVNESQDWIHVKDNIGGLIPANATDVQIALGVVDLSNVWSGVYGSGTCHSQAPLLDNVLVTRVDVNGPQFFVRDVDLFQDAFPGDGTITGTIRSDPPEGDEVTLRISDLAYGLAADPSTGGPAAYLYVSVFPPQAAKSGAALSDNPLRFPVVDSLTYNGDKWYCIRVDNVFTIGSYVEPDRYTVDLNDNLFEPGDEIRFVFSATSAAGYTTYWSQFTGTTDNMAAALDYPMEFSALPGRGHQEGGDILYVDNNDYRGSQPFFDTAFKAMGLDGLVDRFDVRGGSSLRNNSLASRVADPLQQLVPVYRKIIWDSGDLPVRTMGMGPYNVADDAIVLAMWLDLLPAPGGLYLTGDNLAQELSGPHPGALALRSWIDYSLVSGSHKNTVGITPRVIAEPGSCFDHGSLDTLLAYGGCRPANDFDIILPGPAAAAEMSYLGGGPPLGAVISQRSFNSNGVSVGVILSGFSFEWIRDQHRSGAHNGPHHLYDIITWLGNNPQPPVGAGPAPLVTSLEPNIPNPFNPVTRIRYVIATPERVDLRVYDVAGRLVRRLVVPDAVQRAGTYDVDWDGTNEAGQRVASGVYFYRLNAGSFTKSRKMVLLK